MHERDFDSPLSIRAPDWFCFGFMVSEFGLVRGFWVSGVVALWSCGVCWFRHLVRSCAASSG